MAYLNYAGACPILPEAEQEVERTLTEYNDYLYSEKGIRWYRTKVQQCRETVAALLHVSNPSSLAFVPNASTANYLLLSSIAWKQGNRILSSTHENPSIRTQLLALKHRDIETQFLPPTSSPQEFLTSVHHALHEPRVRAIVVSHVSHVDGRIFPIAEISALAKEHDTLLIVDGAQAAGHITVNVDNLNCDAYFFSGYKWCRGPLGTGGLVITKRFLKHAPPVISTPTSAERYPASRFEIGTHNIGLIVGLATACKNINQEGLNTHVLQTIREIAKQQLRKMQDMQMRAWDGPHAPGILTFESQHHNAIMEVFQKNNIVVKPFTDYPDGETPVIRMSWLNKADANHVTNTFEKIRK